MLVYANKGELEKLAKNFYNISHTMITIYDANKKSICSYPHKMRSFCEQVRKSEALEERCIECDQNALAMCDKTRSAYTYNCHMGLIEVASPIIQNDIIIGYMLFGQITDKKNKELLLCGLDDIAKAHRLDYSLLKSSINKIPYRSNEYIESMSRIVEMCASYIWQNSFIKLKNDSTAQALKLFIEEKLHSPISAKLLCSDFHLSRSALYNISKKYFGMGISEYITKRKISKAKELLKTKNLSVIQVALAVGYDDVSYFIRIFKKQTGMTPKKYQSIN